MSWQDGRANFVVAGKVADRAGLAAFLEQACRGTSLAFPWDCTVIKVNWFSPDPANYTDARTLDLVLGALPGTKIVVESHSCGRNYGEREVTSSNGRKLLPWIREQERLFLDRTGLGEVLARHGAEYVNATEEVWGGRAAPRAEVMALVEQRAGPVGHPEFYAQVPARLFELHDRAVLLDLAKIKVPEDARGDVFSLCLKNLFGLIVEPNRWAYHTGLPGSIVDIACVYASLFPVLGLAEGIFAHIRGNSEGEVSASWGERYDVVRDAGLVVAGRPLSDVDVAVGREFRLDLSTRALVKLARHRGL